VVMMARASEAPVAPPRICSVRSRKQTPAMIPKSASARILTFDPPKDFLLCYAGIATFFNRSSSSSTLPVPSATHESGSSPGVTGRLVSCRNR
jgi:hypothetical protein